MEVKLTEKQKRFIDFYVETGNAAEASRKAGYKAKDYNTIGSQNYAKLCKFIQEKLAQKEDARIAKQDEVLKFLTSVMRGEVQEECIVIESIGDFLSEARKVNKQVTPKDRTKAAELLAKRYGMLKENVKFTTDRPIIVDDIGADSDEIE